MFGKFSRLAAIATATIVLGMGQASAQVAPEVYVPEQPVMGVNLQLLHAQLNLSPEQEVQWQGALDAMRSSHAEALSNAQQLEVEEQVMLQQPILDFNALHTLHMRIMQQDEQLPEQSASVWLAFYDGLSDSQKMVFSDAFRPGFENIAQHPAKPFDPRTGL